MNIISKVLVKISKKAEIYASKIDSKKSKLIEKGKTRNLYRTFNGHLFWLNSNGFIDDHLKNFGVFEKDTTEAICRLVNKGDIVIDVGANIGYYAVIISKIVGESGKVFAFEPTQNFREVLEENISINQLNNVEVVPYGLSSKEETLTIDISLSSATLHSPVGYADVIDKEIVKLITFDSFINQRKPQKINFIKVDIDGHEPAFFDGAWESLAKYDTKIIFEISHLHYIQAGVTAWEFYDKVKENGYNIFLEKDFSIIDGKEKFLQKCADFSRSSNVLITRRPSLI